MSSEKAWGGSGSLVAYHWSLNTEIWSLDIGDRVEGVAWLPISRSKNTRFSVINRVNVRLWDSDKLKLTNPAFLNLASPTSFYTDLYSLLQQAPYTAQSLSFFLYIINHNVQEVYYALSTLIMPN